MNMNPSLLKFGRALVFAILSAAAGSASATATFGTQVDSYCASQPAQAGAPQQSRPYRAVNFSCTLCHTGTPSGGNLNAFGDASASCNSTTCGAAVNPFCVAHPPGAATITAPAAGTTVAQGQSLTYSAGNPTNPDGFPLSFTWLFSSGMPNAAGQSVSVPMTVAGSITSTLEVRNSVGMLAAGTPPARTVTVTAAANMAPVATIGAPAGNVAIQQGGTVTFQGSGTDPDNNLPLSYSWNFGGGAPNSAQQNPGAVMFNTAGTFSVTFTVTDSLGLASAPVTRVVTVTPVANQAPTASIIAPVGNVTIAQGGTVDFQGSGTDPDNNLPLSYSWNFGGGAPNSAQQNPGAVAFNTAGTFSVTFTVTDSLGLASAPVTRMVTVTPVANQAPTATINAPVGNVTITQGGTVNFQGSGTDPDNNLPLTYSWNFGGGAPNSTAQSPGAVMFNTVGTFTVAFTVTDSLGLASAPVTRVVTVTSPANLPPVATINAPAANVTITQGGTVNFQGSGSDPDNDLPLTYSWNFGGGAPGSTLQNPGAVTFDTAGTFTVSFTVTDSLGLASAAVTRVVTVMGAGQQPVAAIKEPKRDVTIVQGKSVEFKSAEGDRSLTYNWSFPGGTPASSTRREAGKVTYNAAGTFTASLTVTSSQGVASVPATRTITVTPSPKAPVAVINAPASDVTVAQGGTVTFQGSGTDPDNKLPLTYRWNFGGGAPDSAQQNPGAVTFNTVGTFTVSFTVANSKGLVSAPVTRTITVTAAAPLPAATIVAPAMNVSVLPGGRVTFAASGTGEQLSYRWRFPGGSPDNSTRQNPGAIRFRNAGVFTVTLIVTDSGGRMSAPITRVITVAQPNRSPRLDEDCRDTGDDRDDDDHDDD